MLGILALLLTACPGEETGTPGQAVAEAAERTAEVETARAVMTFEQETDGFGFTMTSEGVIDFVNERAEMSMDLPLAPESEEGGSMSMIVEGGVVYMRMPSMPDAPEAPTGWIRMDPDDMPDMVDQGGMGAGPAGEQNPADALDYLRGVSDDVTEEGREEVRGTDTTRYEGTVDLERVIAEAPEEQREQLRRSMERLRVDELPMTVWVDDEGLVRRMRHEIDLSQVEPPEAAEGADVDDAALQPQGTAVITMELFDFGVEADITPPDEDEVTDVDELDLPAPGAPPPPTS